MQEIGNTSSTFWDNPIKIPILSPITPDEHEVRWNNLIGEIQRGDAIFTFDTSNLTSRVITYLDQGTWSHVGTYAGNGQIIEAITSGVVKRSIEAYHHHRYRIGAYRLPGVSAEQIDRMLAFCQSTTGDQYAFRKVMILGLRLVLGIWPSDRRRHSGPNRGIAIVGLELVKLV